MKEKFVPTQKALEWFFLNKFKGKDGKPLFNDWPIWKDGRWVSAIGPKFEDMPMPEIKEKVEN